MSTKTYLFQPDKKFMKQGFFMTDENENVVYEAKVLKQSLIGAIHFEFTNNLTKKTEEHKVGHTVTTSTSVFGMDALSSRSRFKFDGKDIWDYLHEIGVRIDSGFSNGKLGMTYNVSLKGVQIATMKSTTPKGKSILTNPYYYDVTTEEENLDLAFLAAFAFARTPEQAFHD